MKQASLQFKPRSPRSNKAVAIDFDKRNLSLAREVITEPQKFGGPGSITIVWAEAVIDRLEGKSA